MRTANAPVTVSQYFADPTIPVGTQFYDPRSGKTYHLTSVGPGAVALLHNDEQTKPGFVSADPSKVKFKELRMLGVELHWQILS